MSGYSPDRQRLRLQSRPSASEATVQTVSVWGINTRQTRQKRLSQNPADHAGTADGHNSLIFMTNPLQTSTKQGFLKKAFSILMITAMMLPILTKIGILIDFKINQDIIAGMPCLNAGMPCLNKEKRASGCSGICHLHERLTRVDDQEEKQALTNKKLKLEVLYCYINKLSDFSYFLYNFKSKLNISYENELYDSSFISEVFHPPTLILI